MDRTKRSFEHTFFGRGIVAHIAFAEPVCPELRAVLFQSGRAEGARVHNGGTYVNMEGPAFSTRAESLANHRQGCDVIGMTNLGEAKCAREAEIAYATMAMVTDYDCWKAGEAHVTVEMIIANLLKNAELAKAIIARALPQIPAAAGLLLPSRLAQRHHDRQETLARQNQGRIEMAARLCGSGRIRPPQAMPYRTGWGGPLVGRAASVP